MFHLLVLIYRVRFIVQYYTIYIRFDNKGFHFRADFDLAQITFALTARNMSALNISLLQYGDCAMVSVDKRASAK